MLRVINSAENCPHTLWDAGIAFYNAIDDHHDQHAAAIGILRDNPDLINVALPSPYMSNVEERPVCGHHTPLMLAAKYGNQEVVSYLLDQDSIDLTLTTWAG